MSNKIKIEFAPLTTSEKFFWSSLTEVERVFVSRDFYSPHPRTYVGVYIDLLYIKEVPKFAAKLTETQQMLFSIYKKLVCEIEYKDHTFYLGKDGSLHGFSDYNDIVSLYRLRKVIDRGQLYFGNPNRCVEFATGFEFLYKLYDTCFENEAKFEPQAFFESREEFDRIQENRKRMYMDDLFEFRIY